MKERFHDPIQAKPKEKNSRTPWNFEAPQYDDRTNVCAGTHYGVGHNQPVGHTGNPKQFVNVLPQKAKRMTTEVYGEKLEMDK